MKLLDSIKKRRSVLSEIVYIALNIGLAILVLITIRVTGSMWLAFVLVLMGKWRVFAVRPRFWVANIQANLVSTIVSVSFVVLLFVANSADASDSQILAIQSILVILDLCWLLLLKSQSKRIYVVMQAGIALLLGITAIFNLSYGWVASIVVLLVWLVGYATARHILGTYDDERHAALLSLAWGLVLAEIGWLAYHWTVGYPIATPFLPQVSIIVACFGFLTYKSYDSYYHHQVIRFKDVFLPLIFMLNIVVSLVLFFNKPQTIESGVDIPSLLITLAILFFIEGFIYLTVNGRLFSRK